MLAASTRDKHTANLGRERIVPAALCAIILLLGFAGEGKAQLSVALQTNKSEYVAHEGIVATLTVRNTSGRSIVLEGPGGANWYGFQITDRKGKLSAPTRKEPPTKPVFLKQGETINRQIVLSNHYALTTLGRYNISAGVYFRGLQRFINSNQAKIDVLNGRKLWAQVSGAAGPGGRHRYIRYSLLSFTDRERKQVYVKMEDEKSGAVIACYSLGRIIDVQPPQAIIDKKGELHVLFMRGKGSYVYHTIGANGVPQKPLYYRDMGRNRPSLKVLRENGEAYIINGLEYDPATPVIPQKLRLRTLSERPGFLSDRTAAE